MGDLMEPSDNREDSLNKLLSSPVRSFYKPSWKERMINSFPLPKSHLFILLLRAFGIKVGRNVKFLGKIHVKIRGKYSNIEIGDNVVFGVNVDIRNRENGRIVIDDMAYLDDNVRLVAAREGIIEVGVGSELGANTIINSGGRTIIGKFVLFAGFININSSTHGTSLNKYIKDQSHEHGEVTIGDDVWIGSYAAVLINSFIGEGAIIGSHSVVKGEIPPFGIAVGVPAKVVKYRE